jgi:hypothetical protein
MYNFFISYLFQRSNSYHDGKNHYYKRKDGSIYLLLDKYRRPSYNLFDDICELLEVKFTTKLKYLYTYTSEFT